MAIFNELILKEAVRLYSDILAENPVIPMNMSVFTYDSMDGNGAYVNLQMFIGSDITFDKLRPFPIGSGNKLLKTPTQTVDYAYVLTFSAGDITALTSNIAVLMVLVNKQVWPATIVFSNFPVTAGDTATISGLETLANTTSLQILLG